MKVFYCDAGLIADRGHNATHCRALVRALRDAGVETTVLAHREVADNLVREVGARKAFSVTSWERTSQDPLCGWLRSFTDVSQVFMRDFGRLEGVGADSLILYDTVMPAPMLGLIQWVQRAFKPEAAPRVFMSYMEHSGMAAEFDAAGKRALRVASHEPVLYRYASTFVQPKYAPRFFWGSYEPTLAEVYSGLLGRQVADLPNPIQATTSRRDRGSGGGKRERTVGFLGAQRPNKGFPLVPAIAERLLARRPDARVLVHNSWGAMREQMDALAAMAKREPRLEVLHAAQSETQWSALLERCDLLVAPYDLSQYAIGCSGMMLEGVANAIPVVMGEDFASTRVLRRFGMPGTLFKDVAVEPIVAAIEAALDDYGALAARAVKASAQWQAEQGPVQLVKALLALVSGTGRTQNAGAAQPD